MKKIFLALVAITITFVACLKNDLVSPSMAVKNVQSSAYLQVSDENVIITATVTERDHTVTSVVIEWSMNGDAQTDIPMTAGANSIYTGTIPGQVDGTTAIWNVRAINSVGDTLSVSATANTIMWLDYLPVIKLNEVSGAGGDDEKFYELINVGTEPVTLTGYTIYYNANGGLGGAFPPDDNRQTWIGTANHVIQPGGLLLLQGRGVPGSFTTGLTSERILIITLRDPNGNTIDQCVRAKDQGEYAFRDWSFSRIPDGTGPFYFTQPTTPGVMNGTNTAGLTLVPTTP